MAHQKHAKLARPHQGFYARTEFALVGTTCARIDGLLTAWLPELSKQFRTLTATGDHGKDHSGDLRQVGTKQLRSTGEAWNEYDDKLIGKDYDLVLTNGNHYQAARQIVFVDSAKAGTLERRREQLTDVAAVVLCPGATELPAWLEEQLAEQAAGRDRRVQCAFAECDTQLLPMINAATEEKRAPLKALVLAGGKSTRMGTDKSQLVYRTNGQTELQRMLALCQNLGLEAHVSVADLSDPPQVDAPLLADRFPGLGPFGAICTALLTEPNTAWLVLACDLPLLELETLQLLVQERDDRRLATAIKAASKPFPEPLIAIYEPRAYARLLHFLSLGYACPRKVLINSDVALLELTDESPLANANTVAERERILEALS